MSKVRRFTEELRENEARYRHVFSTAYEGIWFIDRDARTTYVNERMASMLGYTTEEMLGHTLFEFVRPEERPSLELHFRQRRRGIRAQYDFRYRRKDGSDLWALICTNPIFDESGEFQGVLGMHTDITERKKAEERLYQLAAIVENSGDAVFSLTLDGVILTWNAAAKRIFGYRADEAVGRNILDFKPADKIDEEVQILHRVKSGETVQNFETECVRNDGTRIQVAITMSPVQDAYGTISRIAAMGRDITRRKHEQEVLRQAQKMEAVGRLAGGIAHDFNNMLAVILGQVGLMSRETGLTPRLEVSLSAVQAAAEQAQSLVRQLVALSQKQVLSSTAVNVNAVVRKTQKMLAHTLERGIRMELHLSPDLGAVWADPTLLEQVLVNLALNARDAMPKGGVLRIATREAKITAAEAKDRGVAAGRMIVLSVQDSGSGIEEACLPHIFEPFFTTKPFGKGTGLGLATADGIVRQSGGFISVTTRRGAGSTFQVYLPRAREAVGQAPASSRMTDNGPPRGGNETILLVDDHALVRSTTRQMLTGCGYRVLEAGRADEALALSQEFEGNIDLILTDVRMPGTSGRELVVALRRQRPSISVIYTSAFTDDEAVARSVRGARAGFVQKPFSLEAVAWKVRETLDRKAAHSSTPGAIKPENADVNTPSHPVHKKKQSRNTSSRNT